MNSIEEVNKQKDYISKVKKINEGKELTYNILTLGCQLNENDSEKLCGMLEEMGYTKVDDTKEADICLFNTCCVRENAEERLLGKLRRTKKIKRNQRNNNSNRWMYDARKAHYRQNKSIIQFC